jgi:DNA-directed RNA polymerase specialized sigma24 family protein
MDNELLDRHDTHDREPYNTPEDITAEWFSPVFLLSSPICSGMRLSVLAARCLRELDNFGRGESCTDTNDLELLHLATKQGDHEARSWVQFCLGGMVRAWLRRHPQKVVACRLESEEDYVAKTFERFWQATASNQQVEFSTLADALRYLRASLNGAILDTLRAYERPRETSLPEPGEPGEPHMEDMTFRSAVWDILKTLLSTSREVRLAYLLFYCGLKPREIIHFCPQEFDDVHEVYGLRRTIMERVLRNADLLRWRLS